MISRQKIYDKLNSNSMLSDEEFYALSQAIDVCRCEDECVGIDCPLSSVKAGDYVDCCTLFAEYAKVITECRIKIASFSTPESDPAKMVDKWLKEMKEIQIALKRENPTLVIKEVVDGRVLYQCKNCGARITARAQTNYCEHCGQKLKFEFER